jgi:deoxyribonuclease-4
MMKIGVHVSIAGKIYEAIDRGVELGCNTIQIFSRNPRGWQVSKLDPKDAAEFRKRKKEAGISPVLVHIPYLINLATPDDKLRDKSTQAYIDDLKRADMLGAEYFVTHLGSHLGTGEEAGIKRFTACLNRILKTAKPRCMVLLENTAGTGNNLGYKFEHISDIISGIKDNKKVGVCFDTQHAFSAGYDLSGKKGIDKTVKDLDRIVGLERLKAVHLNDSKVDLGARADRHEHVGEGRIGKAGMRMFISHPKLRDLPFIMETPKKGPQDDLRNLKLAKSFWKR